MKTILLLTIYTLTSLTILSQNIIEPSESFIPKEIHGNWLRTDGSNEWVYGIYNDRVIYNHCCPVNGHINIILRSII